MPARRPNPRTSETTVRDLCESVTGAVIGVPIGAQCELCYLNYFRVFISFLFGKLLSIVTGDNSIDYFGLLD